MIVDLPDTTTSKITKMIVKMREQGGVVALGRVLTLVVITGNGLEEDAIAAANLAMNYVLIGEADRAFPLTERLLTTPGPVEGSDSPENITLADLRLRQEWDSLRKDPRFQKILARSEPRTILPKP